MLFRSLGVNPGSVNACLPPAHALAPALTHNPQRAYSLIRRYNWKLSANQGQLQSLAKVKPGSTLLRLALDSGLEESRTGRN